MGQELAKRLQATIRRSGKSMYQIAKESGVGQMSISRFMSGDRDIRLETADRLARVVGLKFTPIRTKQLQQETTTWETQ